MSNLNVLKMRTVLLTGLSFVLTGAVIGNAYYQKKQFYPSVVYITKSNPSMAVSETGTSVCYPWQDHVYMYLLIWFDLNWHFIVHFPLSFFMNSTRQCTFLPCWTKKALPKMDVPVSQWQCHQHSSTTILYFSKIIHYR